MSLNDIRPYTQSDVSHELKVLALTVAQTILQGEPATALVGAGTILEATDDPPFIDGILAVSTTGLTTLGVPGVRQTGTLIQLYTTNHGALFVTKNFATDGAGTAVTPTNANAVGRLAGLTVTGGGSWVLDTGCDNLIAEIIYVLSSDGRILGAPNAAGLTGVNVVFRFIPV